MDETEKGKWLPKGNPYGYYHPSEQEIANFKTHKFVPEDIKLGISKCKKCGQRVYGSAAAFTVDPCPVRGE